MKQRQGCINHLLLLVSPLIASSVLAVSPSQAATFALSEGLVEFTTFSQNPLEVLTEGETNTLAIAESGTVEALANVEATFITAAPTASNLSLSIALGEGRDFLGSAESEGRVVGEFAIDADVPFSFDFTADVTLETAIDNPVEESARAATDVSFVLLDTATSRVIEFFELIGHISTPGDRDFIAYQKSDNVTLSNSVASSDFEGNEEFASASIEGSLQSSFGNATTVALVQLQRNRSAAIRVTVAESCTNLVILFCFGVVGVVWNNRKMSN
jgi:hypothetical protein